MNRSCGCLVPLVCVRHSSSQIYTKLMHHTNNQEGECVSNLIIRLYMKIHICTYCLHGLIVRTVAYSANTMEFSFCIYQQLLIIFIFNYVANLQFNNESGCVDTCFTQRRYFFACKAWNKRQESFTKQHLFA